ncbi:hypothetical protein Bca52824_053307 [Brassica carinata]|uniref:Glycosyl transferase family 1 domain-containing protein n=1 Tax=Brassica carinata TaxID=52824 RepID=A0A8X7R698_BRACI|nr:hypothetical protein Bca52824_053307 [Brassica carinata]
MYQVSVVVPLLKLKRSSKVVFYYHFPDLLLAKHTTVSAFAILCKHYQNLSDVTLTVAEAMVAYKPVIACNSGGPMETVKNGVTGYLCEATPEDFSSAVETRLQSQGSRLERYK